MLFTGCLTALSCRRSLECQVCRICAAVQKLLYPREWTLCSPELGGEVCYCPLAAESTEWVFCPRKLWEVAAATWLPGSPDRLSCDTPCLSREGRQPRPASTQVLAADQDSGRGGAAQVLPTAHGPSAACCWEKEISDVQLLPTPPGVAFAPQGARVDGGCPSATDVVLETLLWRVGAVPGLSAQPSTLCSDLCRFC